MKIYAGIWVAIALGSLLVIGVVLCFSLRRQKKMRKAIEKEAATSTASAFYKAQLAVPQPVYLQGPPCAPQHARRPLPNPPLPIQTQPMDNLNHFMLAPNLQSHYSATSSFDLIYPQAGDYSQEISLNRNR